MNISKIKIIWKSITGFLNPFTSATAKVFEYIADCVLDSVNSALGSITEPNKAKIQAALNLAEKGLAILNAIKFLCPTKWQTAYTSSIAALLAVTNALSDLNVTPAELTAVTKAFDEAVKAWKSPDDETCVDTIERIAS